MASLHLTRRLVGFAAALLLIAGAWLTFHVVRSADAGYPVDAVLGDAGSGLRPGADVKLRGVVVGSVRSLTFEEGTARAVLELDPAVRIPRDVGVVVTAKTLLGEKQVELRPTGPLEGPWLAEGDELRVHPERFPTELQAVIAELDRVLGDVPPGDLSAIVDALGAFDRREATTVARNLEQGEELAAFGATTVDEQVARLRAVADTVEALAPRADDWNRLHASLPEWVTVLPERQEALRSTLDALEAFSSGLADLLETESTTIRELIRAGDRIGAVVEPRVHEIGNLVHGIYRYSRMFGEHGGSLDDGTEHAWFRAHIGEEGEYERFCAGLPPEFGAVAPGCLEDGSSR